MEKNPVLFQGEIEKQKFLKFKRYFYFEVLYF